MRVVGLIPLLFALACAHSVPTEKQAQTQECRISLPYEKEQAADCSPQAAAAYDFAFCSVHYILAAVASPGSERLPGADALADSYRKKGIIYTKVSEALSDADTHKKNVALAKKFYESLGGQGQMIASSLEYVRLKCANVETHHAEALKELSEKMKKQPKKGG